jgi:hypothetical protein
VGNQHTAAINGLAFVIAHAVEHMYNFIMEIDDQNTLE